MGFWRLCWWSTIITPMIIIERNKNNDLSSDISNQIRTWIIMTYLFLLFSLSPTEPYSDISNYWHWFDDANVKISLSGIYSITMLPSIRKRPASSTMAKNGASVKWMICQIASQIHSNKMATKKVMWSVCLWTIGQSLWHSGWVYQKSVLLYHWSIRISVKHH